MLIAKVWFRSGALCVAAAMSIFLSGCGKPGIGAIPVSGSVTVNGKPMEGVLVQFMPESPGGRAASGTTNAEGVFNLTTEEYRDGAIPGMYKVAVTKREMEDDGLSNITVDPNDPASMDAIYSQANTRTQTKSFNVIADKWGSTSTSNLSAEVVKGQDNSSFLFEVTGDKKR